MRQWTLLLLSVGMATAASPVKLDFSAPKAPINRSEGIEVVVKATEPLTKDARVFWCNGDKGDLANAKKVLVEGQAYPKPEDCHPMVGGPQEFEGDKSVGPDVSGWNWNGDGPYPIFSYAVGKSGKLVAISDLYQFSFRPAATTPAK